VVVVVMDVAVNNCASSGDNDRNNVDYNCNNNDGNMNRMQIIFFDVR
jgi:hypothetical protein